MLKDKSFSAWDGRTNVSDAERTRQAPALPPWSSEWLFGSVMEDKMYSRSSDLSNYRAFDVPILQPFILEHFCLVVVCHSRHDEGRMLFSRWLQRHFNCINKVSSDLTSCHLACSLSTSPQWISHVPLPIRSTATSLNPWMSFRHIACCCKPLWWWRHHKHMLILQQGLQL